MTTHNDYTMKAYQVFYGELNKHGNQIYQLRATYLNKETALEHCRQIAEDVPLFYGDKLQEGEFYVNGKYKTWEVVGLNTVTVAKFTEIDIITESSDDGPEYDGAGFTEEDRIVNGQYRNNQQQQ